MSDWARANIELRRRRDEMDAIKKRESDGAASADRVVTTAFQVPEHLRPAVRLGGH